MRILFLLAGLGAGGAEKVVNLLARHRAHAFGDTVFVRALNSSASPSYFPYEASADVATLSDSFRSGPFAASSRLSRLRREIGTIQPDLIISFLTKVNILTTLASLGFDAPLILSERNNFKLQRMSGAWRLLMPVAMRRATLLVMQTSAAREALPPKFRNKAVVIPNPVEQHVSPISSAIAGPVPDFVAAGRLDRQKGFDLLLKAFAQMTRARPQSSLMIYGEGPERHALEHDIERLELAGKVNLPGVTANPGQWANPASVFVLSSRFEGFPNVLLEALAAGMPVVAFDCPWGPREILARDEAGLLVTPENVEALALNLLKISVDGALRQKLRAAASVAAARFEASKILELWDDAISESLTGVARAQSSHPAVNQT